MRKGSVSTAIIMIGVGVFYLCAALFPQFQAFINSKSTWPFQIIILGGVFYLAGILSWVPSLFIPATIITGVGGLLYYQNLTGDWASWSYAWALIPGFVGIGLILFGIFGRKKGAILGGLWNIFSSIVMFSIFGFAFGRLPNVEKIWPAALIMLGLFVLLQAVGSKKKA